MAGEADSGGEAETQPTADTSTHPLSSIHKLCKRVKPSNFVSSLAHPLWLNSRSQGRMPVSHNHTCDTRHAAMSSWTQGSAVCSGTLGWKGLKTRCWTLKSQILLLLRRSCGKSFQSLTDEGPGFLTADAMCLENVIPSLPGCGGGDREPPEIEAGRLGRPCEGPECHLVSFGAWTRKC